MSLVEVRDLTKQYEGVQALAGADLQVREAEVHGLVGPNGAGKSTLIKIISGLVKPDGGVFLWDGEPFAGVRGQGGIGLVMQDSQLCDGMSVAENVALGHYPARGGPLRWVSRSAVRRSVRELLDALGIDVDPAAPASALGLATRRMVEVAKAVAREPRLLVLDEPTAALGPRETRALLDLIGRLGERGVAVLFVTHRLAEIVEVCDRATVMRDGATAGVIGKDELTVERLVTTMTGHEPQLGEPPPAQPGRSRLQAERLCGERFQDVDLELRAGELTVVTGLAGSGRSSVLRSLVGLQRSRGRVHADGTELRRRGPRAAARNGVRFIPETRSDGLIEHLSVLDNLVLPLLASGALSRFGFVRRRKLRRVAEQLAERFDIKTADVREPIWQLSGGNQRKAMLAACFGVGPSVMLIDEPTEGVDVAAKAEIHRLLHGFAADGGAVAAVMSEADECLEAGHRFVVMRNGRIAGAVRRSEGSKSRLTELSFGHDRAAQPRQG